MKLVRKLIQITEAQAAKLKALRAQGYTESGFIRHLLEQHFLSPGTRQKGR